jgi:glycerol-3-phosphate cytidylyltransferase-like family protein
MDKRSHWPFSVKKILPLFDKSRLKLLSSKQYMDKDLREKPRKIQLLILKSLKRDVTLLNSRMLVVR